MTTRSSFPVFTNSNRADELGGRTCVPMGHLACALAFIVRTGLFTSKLQMPRVRTQWTGLDFLSHSARPWCPRCQPARSGTFQAPSSLEESCLKSPKPYMRYKRERNKETGKLWRGERQIGDLPGSSRLFPRRQVDRWGNQNHPGPSPL